MAKINKIKTVKIGAFGMELPKKPKTETKPKTKNTNE